MLEVKGQPAPVLASALGQTLGISEDLVIVAQPGTGKSSALFQLAEASVSAASGTPLVVSLSDWSTGGVSLIDAILRRPAFSGFTEADLRAVAAQPGVVFMFDSWNELGSDARRRARNEIQTLRAELPEATFIATTRPEISDVPFEGQRLTVLELNEQQQMDIAHEIKGDDGIRLVDEAWRTPGVRELVRTPLYLTALLSLPVGEPVPRTKEEVLRRFVEAHERQAQHTEPLKVVTHGLQDVFLSALAVTATRAANTSITDSNARRSVSQTDELLVADGQITIKPQPNEVLDALVSHHVLVRTGEPVRYRFQHQQIPGMVCVKGCRARDPRRRQRRERASATEGRNAERDALGRADTLRRGANGARRRGQAESVRHRYPRRLRGRPDVGGRNDLPSDRRRCGRRYPDEFRNL